MAAGDGGDEVLRGGPRRQTYGEGGVELADHAELDVVEGGVECHDLGDGVHQLVPVVVSPVRSLRSLLDRCKDGISSGPKWHYAPQ